MTTRAAPARDAALGASPERVERTAAGARAEAVVATQADAQDDKHLANVENLVSQKVDAIVVILGDATTLAPALQQAVQVADGTLLAALGAVTVVE